MYILFGESGNIEASILHGQPVRQGNNVDIYVCFPYEDKYKSAKPVLSYSRDTEWIDMNSVVPSSDSPYPFVFTRDYVDEAVFGFKIGQTYLCYHFSVLRETGFTEKFGIVKLQIRVSDENGEYNFLGTANVNVIKTYGNSSTGISMSNYLNLLKKIEEIQESMGDFASLTKDNVFLGGNEFNKGFSITKSSTIHPTLKSAKFLIDEVNLIHDDGTTYRIRFPQQKDGTIALKSDLNDYVTKTGLATALEPYVTTSDLNTKLTSYSTISYVDEKDGVTLNKAKDYTDEAISKIDHSSYAKLDGDNTFTGQNTFEKGVYFSENNAKLVAKGLYSDTGNLFYPTFTIRGDASGAYFAYAYQSDDADLTLYAKKAYVDSTFATKTSISDFASLSKDNAFTAKNDFQGEVTVKDPTEDSNPVTKGYADRKISVLATKDELETEKTARSNGDTNTLASAKSYTDSKIEEANLSDFASKSKANVFSNDNTFNKNVVVKGDLTVNGVFTKVNAETISTKQYTIALAKGNTAPIASYVGMYAEKYDGTNDGALVWDNTGTAYVGDVKVDENGKVTDGSNLQPLLTREEATSLSDKAILFWSADGSKATQGKDSGGTVYTLDYLANIVAKFGDYLPLSGGTASGDITSTNGANDTTLTHNGVISHVDGYQHDVRFSSQGIWATDNDFALSFPYGITGTIAYAKASADADLALYAKKKDLPSTADCVKYTTNTVDVAGTSKDVAKVTPNALFVPNGLVMGGSAQQAGLATRGICGVTTPDSTTGACSKDPLYVNFDGDNTYSRGLILGASSAGAAIDLNTAQNPAPKSLMGNIFSAVRGDQMVNYVINKINAIDYSTFLRTTGAQTATGVKSFTDGIATDTINSKATGNSMLRMYYDTDKVYKVLVGSVNRQITLLGSADRPYYAKDGDGYADKGIALVSDLGGYAKLDGDNEFLGTNSFGPTSGEHTIVYADGTFKTHTTAGNTDGTSYLPRGIGDKDYYLAYSTSEDMDDRNLANYAKKGETTSIPPIGTILAILSDNEADRPAAKYPNTTWQKIDEGRVIIGAGSTYEAGTTGGSATHTLTVAEMPKHRHDLKVKGTTGDWETVVNTEASGAAPATSSVVINETGGSEPFSIVPPYYAAYIWVRTA